MGHIHQLRHRHLGKQQAGEDAEADVIAARQDGGATVLSVVYVTASPTFTGAIGGYTTLNAADPVNQQSSQSSSTSSVDDTFATISAATSSSTSPPDTSTPSPQSTNGAASSISSMMTSAIATSLVTSVSQSKSSPTIAGGAVAENTASSTAQASTSTVQTAMSAGAKAGLAIGLLLAIAAVAVGVLFLYGKKKRAIEENEKPHNEKAPFGTDAAPMASSLPNLAPPNTTNIGSSAPMLDLRPMSRLMPELMGQRRSQGNLLNTLDAPKAAAAPAPGQSRASPPGSSPWERRPNTTEEKIENPFSDPINPFGDEQAKPASPSSVPVAPVDSPSMPAPLKIRSVAPVTAAGAAITGAVVAATTAAKTSENPTSNQSTVMPQGIAGAVAGPGGPPNNVHCVQLDFKPSMEDELELRSGQLVRILHEYDDGWALCIRLDRSQQGVAPRTCLSPKPVKPRPINNDPRRAGPRDPHAPLGPNGRPMTPNGGPLRPMSPARGPGSRPMSPAGIPGSRPMSPARIPGSRPMSPARGPGSRPMSPARVPGSRPMTPNGAPGSRPMTPTGGPGHRFNGPPPMSPAGSSRMRANSSAAPSSRPISPSSAPFNQTPRPLSPGPIAGSNRALRPQQQRSMSPGPYGGAAKPGKMVAANQRRRSNSASALDVRERRNTPPGPSPLGSAAPPGWVPQRRPLASDAGLSQS